MSKPGGIYRLPLAPGSVAWRCSSGEPRIWTGTAWTDPTPDERARLIRARDDAHAETMRELRELAVIAPASIVWRIAR